MTPASRLPISSGTSTVSSTQRCDRAKKYLLMKARRASLMSYSFASILSIIGPGPPKRLLFFASPVAHAVQSAIGDWLEGVVTSCTCTHRYYLTHTLSCTTARLMECYISSSFVGFVSAFYVRVNAQWVREYEGAEVWHVRDWNRNARAR